MRHLFDQYDAWENRLTHALACSLREDQALLRRFVHEFVPKAIRGRPPLSGQLHVSEQHVPGKVADDSEVHRRSGLPDLWIDDGNAWALLIESKIESASNADQLERHLHTARRRGWPEAHALLLTKPSGGAPVLDRVARQTWPELYVWMRERESESKSVWAHQLRTYMEVVEGRMVEEGKMQEGTLTEFSGIPFGHDTPYTYIEARRLLGLALDDLRRRPALAKLGVVPSRRGRPAVTGARTRHVWDFLALPETPAHFAHGPHLDLFIDDHQVGCHLVLGKGYTRRAARHLLALDDSSWVELFVRLRAELARALRDAPGAAPRVYLQQVRWVTQRGPVELDAVLSVDLDTAFRQPSIPRKPPVKYRPAWLHGVREVLAEARGQLEMSIGATFAFDRCAALRSVGILDVFERVWLGTKPMLDVLRSPTR